MFLTLNWQQSLGLYGAVGAAALTVQMQDEKQGASVQAAPCRRRCLALLLPFLPVSLVHYRFRITEDLSTDQQKKKMYLIMFFCRFKRAIAQPSGVWMVPPMTFSYRQLRWDETISQWVHKWLENMLTLFSSSWKFIFNRVTWGLFGACFSLIFSLVTWIME